MIQMTMDYHAGIPPTNATATPIFRNILFENLLFQGGSNAGRFVGLAESPLQNITLRNVSFNGGDAKFSSCEHVLNGVCDAATTPCPSCFGQLSPIASPPAFEFI